MWELADNVGVNLGQTDRRWQGVSIFHVAHTHQTTSSSYPKDNGRYGPLGLDIILFIVADGSNFPCNILKGE